jgi:NitT/TauT family transport system ATP-binding protein
MSVCLDLNDVCVDYAQTPVLGPLTLAVPEGEVMAIVGPSGCGKSTLLRLLSGLENPTRGTLSRAVGPTQTSVVFQAPTLAPWLDATRNVALPLELAGVGTRQACEQAQMALSRVGLQHALLRRPGQLSGGMAMRASLARALVTSPRLMLLDEPFAALDEITRRHLADDILEIWSSSRPTLVLVTHNVEEAVYLASRVLVLTSGPGRSHSLHSTGFSGPRPQGHRASVEFRQVVETVSTALAEAMA